MSDPVKLELDVAWFLANPPPAPHRGWNLPAFQDHCRSELLGAGFDMSRPFHCYYNRQFRKIVFYQEVREWTFKDLIRDSTMN